MVGYVDKLTVIIKRNASYEKGMYGISFHDQPGGAANVEPIDGEEQLREKLLGFGLTKDHAGDVIERLKNKHDSVKLSVDPAAQTKERFLGREKATNSVRYDCNQCSWSISMEQDNIGKARQLFSEHVCADNPPFEMTQFRPGQV
jgi:Fe2+ transport system protein FeoA